MLIGELAATAGLSAKTIRFYEQAGLMPAPPRTPAGYRDYPPGAPGRLAFVGNAQAAGFTLAEIRSVLAIRDSGDPPCRHVATLIGQHLAQVERRIAELTRTHDVLIDLQRRAAAINPADCAESEICSILTAPLPAPRQQATARRTGATTAPENSNQGPCAQPTPGKASGRESARHGDGHRSRGSARTARVQGGDHAG